MSLYADITHEQGIPQDDRPSSRVAHRQRFHCNAPRAAMKTAETPPVPDPVALAMTLCLASAITLYIGIGLTWIGWHLPIYTGVFWFGKAVTVVGLCSCVPAVFGSLLTILGQIISGFDRAP